jgi:hypothetical protein
MEKNDIIFIVVFAISMAVIVIGMYFTTVKPIEPNVILEPCECVSECLQDYEKFGTVNYFTWVSHKSWSFESRDCKTLSDEIVATCCQRK